MVKQVKILIIGKNSFLSCGLESVLPNYCLVDRVGHDSLHKVNYALYDVIINFAINPQCFCRAFDEDEILDIQIAKKIQQLPIRYIFISSRKVYGVFNRVHKLTETDALNPAEFYGHNKLVTEMALLRILGKQLTILRVSNVVGFVINAAHKSFISMAVISKIILGNPIDFTISPYSKKDFITLEFFQSALIYFITHNTQGIYNVGAGFATSLDAIVYSILSSFGPWKINLFSSSKSDQFYLNIAKLKKIYNPFFSQTLLIEACKKIGSSLKEFIKT